MIISAWVDTETTGLEPCTSGAFEIALLIYYGPKLVFENLYHLNPLNDEIKWSDGAYKVNGVSEEKILSYPSLDVVMQGMAEDLSKHMPTEKFVFAGYNCPFDYGHIDALFSRCGYRAADFFNSKLIDVYDLVKKAAGMGLLPKTQNQRLETMTKALGIEHGVAHTALDDIKATRRLYETIYRISKGGRA